MEKEKQSILVDKINHVKQFHSVFQIGSREIPNGSISEEEFMLRYRLMKEENDEYLEACKNGDLTEIADALGVSLDILMK